MPEYKATTLSGKDLHEAIRELMTVNLFEAAVARFRGDDIPEVRAAQLDGVTFTPEEEIAKRINAIKDVADPLNDALRKHLAHKLGVRESYLSSYNFEVFDRIRDGEKPEDVLQGFPLPFAFI